MHICCLDLEGVLLPEIWIQVADRFKKRELRLTTRDVPDYDKLMKYRLGILRKEGIRLKDIQRVIRKMEPLPGARRFLDQLRSQGPVVILSDTFYEFALPAMRKLGDPALFCNWLQVDKAGFIAGYTLRQKDGKRKAVLGLKKLGFEVRSAGDSYNDLTMLKTANRGVLFSPPDSIRKSHPEFPVARDYRRLFQLLQAKNG